MDPFIGEIRMFGGNFPPVGWAWCNGQLLSISQNDILFSLLGTTYGGDGQTTFALPDLRGRIPIHRGTNPQTGTTYNMGGFSGAETVTLTVGQMAAHTHLALAQAESGNQTAPTGNVWAKSTVSQFATVAPTVAMSAQALSAVGGSQPHDNVMPFLAINYIIATEGLYPQQS